MIVLITPTGGRPKQFELCMRWMKNQTYSGKVCWIVVDDCEPKTTDLLNDDFRENWTIIKKYPKPEWKEGMNTQGRNLGIAFNEIKSITKELIDAIFIIEDDDYYKPIYIEKMLENLQGYDVVGETKTIYYNVRYHAYTVCNNCLYASLFQTCFTMDVLPIIMSCLNRKFIDIEFFKIAKNVNLIEDEKFSVGMKGLPGRFGIGKGHRWRGTVNDSNHVKLKELLKEDYIYYTNDFFK